MRKLRTKGCCYARKFVAQTLYLCKLCSSLPADAAADAPFAQLCALSKPEVGLVGPPPLFQTVHTGFAMNMQLQAQRGGLTGT